jgi:L-histidine N-alpha-methyltransferase
MTRQAVQTSPVEADLVIDDHRPMEGNDDSIDEILRGLTDQPRRIASKFFYDGRGSALFEQITRLPEYYPTRLEYSLLRRVAPQLGPQLDDTDIVELGSGDCSKISILLNGMDRQTRQSLRYMPIDISRDAVSESASALVERYPELSIHGVVADFLTQLDALPNDRSRLFCFFGSTVGNLSAGQRLALWHDLAAVMSDDDRLLLGVDMVKPQTVLECAYNDAQHVTARFNLNILNVANRIIGSNFEPTAFEHLAFYNPDHHRIEMHLRAKDDMTVSCPHLSSQILIEQHECIHTENSHKFTLRRIARELRQAGLRIESLTTDDQRWFALMQIAPAG